MKFFKARLLTSTVFILSIVAVFQTKSNPYGQTGPGPKCTAGQNSECMNNTQAPNCVNTTWLGPNCGCGIDGSDTNGNIFSCTGNWQCTGSSGNWGACECPGTLSSAGNYCCGKCGLGETCQDDGKNDGNGICQCGTHAACQPGAHCKLDGSGCIECKTGEIFVANATFPIGVCQCGTGPSCNVGETCTNGVCTCGTSGLVCPSGMSCGANGTCTCTSDTQCPSESCLASGNCGMCSTNAQCPSAKPSCVIGLCMKACQSSSDCPSNESCMASGYCGNCTPGSPSMGSQCPSGQSCQNNTCVASTTAASTPLVIPKVPGVAARK